MYGAQKCSALVGVETVLTSARPEITLFHGGQYMAENGNMRNLGLTNFHCTAFAPKQCIYQKEAKYMKNSKL